MLILQNIYGLIYVRDMAGEEKAKEKKRSINNVNLRTSQVKEASTHIGANVGSK